MSIVNPLLICEKSINETELSKGEERNRVKSTMIFDKSIDKIYLTKDEECNKEKPTLICREERGGGRHFSCSFCPQKKWKDKSAGRHHVINGKYHDQSSAHDSGRDHKTPTVLISRGKDREKIISCSACFKTFKFRSQASLHIKTAKIHTDAIEKQEIKIENRPSVTCRNCKEKFIKRDDLEKHRPACEGVFNKISKKELREGEIHKIINGKSRKVKQVRVKLKQLKSTSVGVQLSSITEDGDLVIKKEPENFLSEDGSIKVENSSNGLQLNNTLTETVKEFSNSQPTIVNDDFSNALALITEGESVKQNTIGEDSAIKPTLLCRPQIAGGKTYICSFCPQKIFSNKRRAVKHVIEAKYHDQNSADQLGNDPEKATVLISRREDGKRRISCSACFKTFTKRSSASKHVKYVKTHFRMIQDEGMNNDSDDGIQFHQMEKEERPFLLKETNSTDGKVLYRCNLCPNIIFVHKTKAKRHLLRHMPVEKRKRFSCFVCKKKFVGEYNLIRHRSTKCKV